MTKETAERASRYSHFMYWGLLVFPGLIGFFNPGLTHYDAILGVPSLPLRFLGEIIGALLVLMGGFLLIITNRSLARVGNGAAAFILTKRVVIERAYKYTRNPMSLGYYVACLGVGFLAGSTSLVVGTLLVVIPAHIFNLKYFEELELELRYGQPYQEYKIGVPFLLPNLMARRTAAK